MAPPRSRAADSGLASVPTTASALPLPPQVTVKRGVPELDALVHSVPSAEPPARRVAR